MDNKKSNFKRISENRVSKILILLQQLTNLSNFSFYEYTADDIEKIFDVIEHEVQITKDVLIKAYDKRKNIKFEL